jgi:heme/copper-type cytochrome/quinol oxidase subunit 2
MKQCKEETYKGQHCRKGNGSLWIENQTKKCWRDKGNKVTCVCSFITWKIIVLPFLFNRKLRKKKRKREKEKGKRRKP